MGCAAYRRAVLADPGDPDHQLHEHLAACHECSVFTARLRAFDTRLERALRLELPASSPRAADGNVVPLRTSAPYRRGWLAMAASVLVAVIVAGGLWLSVPNRSLAADVVTHMAEEPQAWRRTDVPVPGAALEGVLRDSHLRLAAGAGLVSYASSCEFRGRHVPHLVLQTESGPVTVMVLVHEPARRSSHFDEHGYRGIIVPVPGHGSLAVLTRGPDTDIKTVEHIAARVLNSIVWTG